MKIYGLQKMTLLDYPGHVACTVFLGGCDMRCPFCHNSELTDGTAEPVMTMAGLMVFLTKRKGLLEGVAVTGGEPLLRTENLDLLRRIRETGYPVKLDTNGTHPELLRRALEEDLAQYVAMDIKNSPERYPETIGLKSFDLSPVRESITLLMAGKTDYEFRTTVTAELHDEAGIQPLFTQTAVNAEHRDFHNIGGCSLDRAVHGYALAKLARDLVLHAELGDRAASAVQGGRVALLVSSLYDRIQISSDAGIGGKIGVDIRLRGGGRDAKVTRKRECANAVHDAKVYRLGLAAKLRCYLFFRYAEHGRCRGGVDVLVRCERRDHALVACHMGKQA